MQNVMGEMLADVSTDIRDGLEWLDTVEARMLDAVESVKWDAEKVQEEMIWNLK